MKAPQGYILVVDQQSEDLQVVESVLSRLSCSVFIAESPDQAVAQASQTAPYLVILSGNNQSWSNALVYRLRQTVNTHGVTIVALTDSGNPSWSHQEDHPGLDGFLVKPLSRDVLSTLIQSAIIKQACCWTS
ncbi:MAG: hypothetical protein MJA27_24105 [Pseudanabaenales cyanobacterium]|nr:hypothetical protein [Pseudanabaenales cyanobacterium]